MLIAPQLAFHEVHRHAACSGTQRLERDPSSCFASVVTTSREPIFTGAWHYYDVEPARSFVSDFASAATPTGLRERGRTGLRGPIATTPPAWWSQQLGQRFAHEREAIRWPASARGSRVTRRLTGVLLRIRADGGCRAAPSLPARRRTRPRRLGRRAGRTPVSAHADARGRGRRFARRRVCAQGALIRDGPGATRRDCPHGSNSRKDATLLVTAARIAEEAPAVSAWLARV